MKQDRYVIFTGAMGGGKSTILRALPAFQSHYVAEPAREILLEQRALGAPGVPENNPDLFTRLMLSRSIHDFKMGAPRDQLVFDRAIPDMIAYANLFGLDPLEYQKAAMQYRYNDSVFYFPPWKEIYSQDEERKIGFEGARDFGIRTKEVYEELGYRLIEVPLVPIGDRVRFILEKLASLQGTSIGGL